MPQRCSEEGEWVATQAGCAFACLAGECVECVAGASQCSNGAAQECISGTWTSVVTCSTVCENAACVDECTEGYYQCNGRTTLQECVGGEYVDDTDCDYLCSVDECSGECVPDTKRCNPDATDESQTCNARGQWGESAPCASGTFCVAGACKPCSPGTARCGTSGPQLCGETGEWINQGACASPLLNCFDGACVLCRPGDRQCTSNAVEECSTDGSAWEQVEVCGGTSPVCLDRTQTCGSCIENDTQCGDGEVQVCDSSGAWQTGEACSDPTPRCFESVCTECDSTTGERQCDTATSFQVCGSNGGWATATPCSGDSPFCRDDLGSVCGCEEGLRRCRNSTVPEICQGGTWVADDECVDPLGYCLPATGSCVDCEPNTEECRDQVAYACGASGTWSSLASCAGSTVNCGGCDLGESCESGSDCGSGVCLSGACVECSPGSRTCSSSVPRQCSSLGSWQDESCSDGLACTNDVCTGNGVCSNEPTGGYCVIGGQCVPPGADWSNVCRSCDAQQDLGAWTPSSITVECGAAQTEKGCTAVSDPRGCGADPQSRTVRTYCSGDSSFACNRQVPSSWQVAASCGTNTGCDAQNQSCVTKLGCGTTWCDSETGLCWTTEDTGDLSHLEAVNHCQDLVLAGRSDWQLPTLQQWFALARACDGTTDPGTTVTESTHSTCFYDSATGDLDAPSCYPCTFLGGPAGNGCYWPSAMGSCTTGFYGYWSSTVLAGGTSQYWYFMAPYNVGGYTDQPLVKVRCVLQE